MAQVTLTEHNANPYILLNPQYLPPREGPAFSKFLRDSDIRNLLDSLKSSPIIALDFETRGGDYSYGIGEHFEPVGIGLAWNSGSCYLELSTLTSKSLELLDNCLQKHTGVVAHNVYFDGGVYHALFGRHLPWHMCTYSLYAFLANEGVPDRHWGLKQAQRELLLWEQTNEAELDEWLVTNGYYTGNRRISTDPEYLKGEYAQGKLGPNKGEMWRAPTAILGKYCILDAESTYLLYVRILAPALRKFPELETHMSQWWMPSLLTLVDQKFHGMHVDRPGLVARLAVLEEKVAELHSEFLNHEETSAHILEMEKEWADEAAKGEPTKLKKDGGISKNWLKFQEKMEKIRTKQDPVYCFNLSSGPQLRELLYGRLGYECRIRTEKGEPSTGVKALRFMGGVGNILVRRSEYVKEKSYIEKYIELTTLRDSIHPSFRTPGTSTGRLSGKEPNIQQIPKSKEVMSLFRARPGYLLVDLDFAALEPTVTTEFSNDENMAKIYGNGASPYQDFYLYIGSSIPGIRERLLAAGYDPENPTKEGTANAKKECKADRNVCKTVALACAYGAGVKKVHTTLEEQDIYVPFPVVEAIHSGYWKLFSQVREFGRSLQFELRSNRGYLLNGIGRPMAVPPDFERDALNRFIQSTGHDVLVKYTVLLAAELNRSGAEWAPIIMDLHDASTIEVREDQADLAVTCFNKAMDQLNALLGGQITLRGKPTVGATLADVKEAE